MEFIFDELKQYDIQKVNNFDMSSNKYLLVLYKKTISEKDIDKIIIINNSENYLKKNYNIIKYGYNNEINQINELFIIDKKFNSDDIISLTKYILSDSKIKGISCYRALGKNNYMICNEIENIATLEHIN